MGDGGVVMRFFRLFLAGAMALGSSACVADLNDNECNVNADCRHRPGTVCSVENWCVSVDSSGGDEADGQPALDAGQGANDAGSQSAPGDAISPLQDSAAVDAARPAPDAAPPMEDEWTRLLGPCAHAPLYTPDPLGPPRSDSYMEAFREVDFDLLPSRWRTEELTPIHRSVLVFALGIPPVEFRNKLVLADLMAQKPMGVVVAAAFATPGNRLNYTLLLGGLARFYNCAQGFPATLDDFRETVFDYQMMAEIDSAAKCTPRRIYENRDTHVYVAETVEEGEVRETEIIIGEDGVGTPMKFLVYDAAGRLSDRSTFPTVGGSLRTLGSPQICLGCHVDFERDPTLFDYDDLVPTGTGVCAN